MEINQYTMVAIVMIPTLAGIFYMIYKIQKGIDKM
jgi:hypothetical protein